MKTIISFLNRLISRPKYIHWNPYIIGYPRSLKKKFWDHPSSLIGREFDHVDGRYRVISWEPSIGCDIDENDGAMKAVKIS